MNADPACIARRTSLTLCATSACALILTATATAGAESYGPPHPRGLDAGEEESKMGPILGFENLFGYSSSRMELKSDDASATSKQSQFSFLGGGLANPYLLPGLSLDMRLGETFTLGGALRYASLKTEAGDVSVTGSQFGLAGRMGFMLGSKSVAFWPRLGFAYQSLSGGTAESAGTRNDVSSTALSIEAPILIRSAHLGLSIGPALCLPLSGSGEVTSGVGAEPRDVDVSLSSFALVVSGYAFL